MFQWKKKKKWASIKSLGIKYCNLKLKSTSLCTTIWICSHESQFPVPESWCHQQPLWNIPTIMPDPDKHWAHFHVYGGSNLWHLLTWPAHESVPWVSFFHDGSVTMMVGQPLAHDWQIGTHSFSGNWAASHQTRNYRSRAKDSKYRRPHFLQR